MNTAAGGTVSIVLLRALVLAAQRAGVERTALLATVGLEPSTLDNSDITIAGATLLHVWAEAARMSGDSTFGLHAGERSSLGDFEVLDYVVLNSRTIGEALRRAARYYAIVSDQVSVSVDAAGKHARFVHVPRVSVEHDGARHAWESYVAATVSRLRIGLGENWHPEAVSFVHPRVGDGREHLRVLGVAPRFGAPVNEIVLDRHLLDRTISSADIKLGGVLVPYAEALLAKRATPQASFVDQVREQIARSLADGVSLSRLARRMATSGRTLQRRLADDRTSFNELLDGVRHRLALGYLATPSLALTEIAFLLGFAQPHAFHRAFRRWTGTTPAAYRAVLASN